MRDHPSRIRRQLVVLLALSCGVLLAAPELASAQLGLQYFTNEVSTSQAGAHADFTTEFGLNRDALGNPDGQLRDAAFKLPAGLIGNPLAVERCSMEALRSFACDSESQVGTLTLTAVKCRGVSTTLLASATAGTSTLSVPDANAFCSEEGGNVITLGAGPSAETAMVGGVVNATTIELSAPLEHEYGAGEQLTHIASTGSQTFPLFNVQPSPGHVATFAASLFVADILVQVNVGEDGQLMAALSEASTLLPIVGSALTLWGVPSAASHDAYRCNDFGFVCGLAGGKQVPFMTNPTSCAGASSQADLEITSWQGESASGVASLPPFTGCEQLAISPGFDVAPTTRSQDEPSGYEVDLQLPQNEQPSTLATPALEKVLVTLPAGVSLSPGLANGLQSCSTPQFAQADCPAASRIGTAEVSSPVLAEALKGGLYLGAATTTEKYRLFMRVSAGSTTIALSGVVQADAQTGQVTTVFQSAPELPFGELKFNFFGGPTAALANPLACGVARSGAVLTAYSGQSESLSSTFEVNEGSGGGPCLSRPPFSPSFAAGTTSVLAGRSSPFVLAVSRTDGQQYLSGFSAHLPPGLVGLVRNVSPCTEPAAATGACGPASKVGTATIAAGSGSLPLEVSGPVYLTRSYGGAPFGLDIVVKATAGPFELGTVLVRSRIYLDSSTLAMTIVSDSLPQMLEGIPLRMRRFEVDLDRAGFLVNPTSCAPQAITATIPSSQGAGAKVSVPFRVAGCRDLAFSPRLSASTQANADSHSDGAGIDIDITEPHNAQASIRSVTTRLPKQLRPRLANFKHACQTDMQLSSLVKCPSASIVGHVTARSPVTVAPLVGPIYLVARPGFVVPSMVLVLRGEGIAVEVEGALSISTDGVTSATFRRLPDVPLFSFDLTLPRGPHSILGAVSSLCLEHPSVDFQMGDRNGRVIKGATQIAVKGCPQRSGKRRRTRHNSNAR
jgi:hypothetical protein